MAMKIITGYTSEKHITPVDDARFHKALFGDEDYVLSTGSQLAATIESATEIRIADGELVMQGRYARNDSTYETVPIENGSQGMYRNDLIVARYAKDTSTSIESIKLVVITGTADASSATDPEYNTGDIESGETRDFPLYRVKLNGITIESVEQLWTSAVTSTDRGGTGVSVNSKDELLLALGGISITKLWENASPTSNFAAQTIALNLSEYDYILMDYKGMNSSSHVESAIIKVGNARFVTYMRYVQSEHVLSCYSRTTTVNTTGVVFNDAARHDVDWAYSETANSGIVPVAIYGIKGVQ